MVSLKSVERQLKRIHYNHHSWNRAEAMELPAILMPDEEIFECVNGWYEGGFALLCATNVRVLLIDKKPFKFLNVEDLRFDMINQIDYSHRLLGAHISVSAGSKNLQFRSYNQERLRKLIGHLQNRMAEIKKEQSQQAVSQQQHLEQINQQLQAYLLAQYQQQEDLRKQLEEAQKSGQEVVVKQPESIRPSPQLADYLFAQTLMQEYEQTHEGNHAVQQPAQPTFAELPAAAPAPVAAQPRKDPQLEDLYAEGMQEIFGKQPVVAQPATAPVPTTLNPSATTTNPLEVNALRIAYSKLPMALRNRRFSRRPSFKPAVPTPATTPSPTQTAGAQ